jgi:hypothetical protein
VQDDSLFAEFEADLLMDQVLATRA